MSITASQPAAIAVAPVNEHGLVRREHPGVVTADIAALEMSLQRGQVTFNDVARTWFHLCDDDITEAEHERCENLFPKLLAAFGTPRGGIITTYFCRNLGLAAALTDPRRAAQLGETPPMLSDDPDDEPGRSGPGAWLQSRRERRCASNSAIYIESTLGDPADPKARRILFDCLDLHYRAIEFLEPKPRKICLRMVMGIVTSLLGTLDAPRSGGAGGADGRAELLDPQEVACLDAVLEQAHRYYDRSAQRQAQIEYFAGMGVGIAGMLAVLAALSVWLGESLVSQPLLVTPLAAGLGAFVSVLARMTRGQLVLAYESGRSIMRLLGAIRPLLGAILGAALYVLLQAGLVTIPTGPNDTKTFFSFVGIAFVAGFSERFAQDMLARAPGGSKGQGPAPAPATASLPALPR